MIYACSNWVMMNRETRKLSKIPEEVREEVLPFYLDRNIIAGDNPNPNRRIEKLTDATAESVRSGLEVRRLVESHVLPKKVKFYSRTIVLILQPRWSDMDVNQHVNNVKYIGWILEVLPPCPLLLATIISFLNFTVQNI
jgi:fatty acyl-ACP thioesterase B